MPQKLILPLSFVPDLVGKKIKWHAPAAKENQDYEGVCIITKVDTAARRPIVEANTLEGDDITFAFMDEYQRDPVFKDMLCYSDGERFITFDYL